MELFQPLEIVSRKFKKNLKTGREKICTKFFGWENKSGHGNSSGRSLFFFSFFFLCWNGTSISGAEEEEGGGLCARASSRQEEEGASSPRVRPPVAQRQVAKMHLSMNCWQKLANNLADKCGVDIYDDKCGRNRGSRRAARS
jgi:hypothetical protein